MKSAHSHLKIDNQSFDAVRGYLLTTLQELGVDSALVQEVKNIFDSQRSLIVV